jgi:hypothetical protein
LRIPVKWLVAVGGGYFMLVELDDRNIRAGPPARTVVREYHGFGG